MKNFSKHLLIIALISSTALVAAPKKISIRPPQQQFKQIDRATLSQEDNIAFNTAFTALNIALHQYNEKADDKTKEMWRKTIVEQRASLEHLIKTYTQSKEVQGAKGLLTEANAFLEKYPAAKQLVVSPTSRTISASAAIASSSVTPAAAPAAALPPAIVAATVVAANRDNRDNIKGTKGARYMTSWIRDDEELNYWGDTNDFLANIKHIAASADDPDYKLAQQILQAIESK